MFAVIRTGGKQYRVAPNDIIEIEKIAGQPGDIVELGEVLLLGGEGGPKTGSPTIAGALVAAEVLEQKRDDKIIVFKKKRRKSYRRNKGHRQALTALRITEILTDGKKPSKAAPAKAETKPAETKPRRSRRKRRPRPSRAKARGQEGRGQARSKETGGQDGGEEACQVGHEAPAKKSAPKKKS